MDLTISQMMQMQQELFAVHKDNWSPREPEYGKDHILYMIEEIGEAIAILKKKGSRAVMSDPGVRAAFLQEMSDVLMYYTDILLCCHITPEEMAKAYQHKHTRNMERDYIREYEELYQNG